MSMKLKGELFFGAHRIPVNVVKVATRGPDEQAHPYDATEKEHHHDFSELVVIIKGQGLHRVDGEDYQVTAGDVFLLQGRQKHFFHDRENMVIMNLMYDSGRLNLPVRYLKRMPGYNAMFMLEPAYRKTHRFSSKLHLGIAELSKVEAMLEGMMADLKEKKPGYEACLYASLIGLITYLSRQYGRTVHPDSKWLIKIGSIISGIEKNELDGADLSELAKRAGLSKVHFLRVFKKVTGDTPGQYMIRHKVNTAMSLIKSEPGMNITEIAYKCSFSDSNYFARIFRKMTGMTPSQYRELG